MFTKGSALSNATAAWGATATFVYLAKQMIINMLKQVLCEPKFLQSEQTGRIAGSLLLFRRMARITDRGCKTQNDQRNSL